MTKTVLIGSKKDLETNIKEIQKLKERNQTIITKLEGEEMAKKIGAIAYVEISSLTGENVMKVIQATLEHIYGKQETKEKCSLM